MKSIKSIRFPKRNNHNNHTNNPNDNDESKSSFVLQDGSTNEHADDPNATPRGSLLDLGVKKPEDVVALNLTPLSELSVDLKSLQTEIITKSNVTNAVHSPPIASTSASSTADATSIHENITPDTTTHSSNIHNVNHEPTSTTGTSAPTTSDGKVSRYDLVMLNRKKRKDFINKSYKCEKRSPSRNIIRTPSSSQTSVVRSILPHVSDLQADGRTDFTNHDFNNSATNMETSLLWSPCISEDEEDQLFLNDPLEGIHDNHMNNNTTLQATTTNHSFFSSEEKEYDHDLFFTNNNNIQILSPPPTSTTLNDSHFSSPAIKSIHIHDNHSVSSSICDSTIQPFYHPQSSSQHNNYNNYNNYNNPNSLITIEQFINMDEAQRIKSYHLLLNQTNAMIQDIDEKRMEIQSMGSQVDQLHTRVKDLEMKRDTYITVEQELRDQVEDLKGELLLRKGKKEEEKENVHTTAAAAATSATDKPNDKTQIIVCDKIELSIPMVPVQLFSQEEEEEEDQEKSIHIDNDTSSSSSSSPPPPSSLVSTDQSNAKDEERDIESTHRSNTTTSQLSSEQQQEQQQDSDLLLDVNTMERDETFREVDEKEGSVESSPKNTTSHDNDIEIEVLIPSGQDPSSSVVKNETSNAEDEHCIPNSNASDTAPCPNIHDSVGESILGSTHDGDGHADEAGDSINTDDVDERSNVQSSSSAIIPETTSCSILISEKKQSTNDDKLSSNKGGDEAIISIHRTNQVESQEEDKDACDMIKSPQSDSSSVNTQSISNVTKTVPRRNSYSFIDGEDETAEGLDIGFDTILSGAIESVLAAGSNDEDIVDLIMNSTDDDYDLDLDKDDNIEMDSNVPDQVVESVSTSDEEDHQMPKPEMKRGNVDEVDHENYANDDVTKTIQPSQLSLNDEISSESIEEPEIYSDTDNIGSYSSMNTDEHNSNTSDSNVEISDPLASKDNDVDLDASTTNQVEKSVSPSESKDNEIIEQETDDIDVNGDDGSDGKEVENPPQSMLDNTNKISPSECIEEPESVSCSINNKSSSDEDTDEHNNSSTEDKVRSLDISDPDTDVIQGSDVQHTVVSKDDGESLKTKLPNYIEDTNQSSPRNEPTIDMPIHQNIEGDENSRVESKSHEDTSVESSCVVEESLSNRPKTEEEKEKNLYYTPDESSEAITSTQNCIPATEHDKCGDTGDENVSESPSKTADSTIQRKNHFLEMNSIPAGTTRARVAMAAARAMKRNNSFNSIPKGYSYLQNQRNDHQVKITKSSSNLNGPSISSGGLERGSLFSMLQEKENHIEQLKASHEIEMTALLEKNRIYKEQISLLEKQTQEINRNVLIGPSPTNESNSRAESNKTNETGSDEPRRNSEEESCISIETGINSSLHEEKEKQRKDGNLIESCHISVEDEIDDKLSSSEEENNRVTEMKTSYEAEMNALLEKNKHQQDRISLLEEQTEELKKILLVSSSTNESFVSEQKDENGTKLSHGTLSENDQEEKIEQLRASHKEEMSAFLEKNGEQSSQIALLEEQIDVLKKSLIESSVDQEEKGRIDTSDDTNSEENGVSADDYDVVLEKNKELSSKISFLEKEIQKVGGLLEETIRTSEKKLVNNGSAPEVKGKGLKAGLMGKLGRKSDVSSPTESNNSYVSDLERLVKVSQHTILVQRTEIQTFKEVIDSRNREIDKLQTDSYMMEEKVAALETHFSELNQSPSQDEKTEIEKEALSTCESSDSALDESNMVKADPLYIEALESKASENSIKVEQLEYQLKEISSRYEKLLEQSNVEGDLRDQISRLSDKLKARDLTFVALEKSFKEEYIKSDQSIQNEETQCPSSTNEKAHGELKTRASQQDQTISDLKQRLSILENEDTPITPAKIHLLQEIQDASVQRLDSTLAKLEDAKISKDMEIIFSISDKLSLMQDSLRISLHLLECKLTNEVESLLPTRSSENDYVNNVVDDLNIRFERNAQELHKIEERFEQNLGDMKEEVQQQHINLLARDKTIERMVQSENKQKDEIKSLRSELDVFKSLGKYASVNVGVIARFKQQSIMEEEIQNMEREIQRLNSISNDKNTAIE